MRSLSSNIRKQLSSFTRGKALGQFLNKFGYHPIRLQDRVANNTIQCNICNRRCRVSTYDFGLCNAVFNAGDDLISTTYGMLAQSLDDYSVEHIERVGLLHYKPGMSVLCPINMHCNFRCIFCYQSGWSHTKPIFHISGNYISPQNVIEIAAKQGVEGIAFSMAEPTMFLDFLVDTALLAKEAGLNVIMNSNGYMTQEAIELLVPVIDAVSISFKGLGNTRIYNEWLLTGPADPTHVLQSIKLFHEKGVHVEVIGIFTRQDCEVETNPRNLSAWLVSNVDRQVPFVLLPLRPWTLEYPVDLFYISENESNRIVDMCRQSGLVHIYILPGGLAADKPPDLVTRCPNCGDVVVKRKGQITGKSDELNVTLVYVPDVCEINVIDGKGYCKRCNNNIYGVWGEKPKPQDRLVESKSYVPMGNRRDWRMSASMTSGTPLPA